MDISTVEKNKWIRSALVVALMAACLAVFVMLAGANDQRVSGVTVNKQSAEPYERLTYAVEIVNDEDEAIVANLLNPLPKGLVLVPNSIVASSRSAEITTDQAKNTAFWQGEIPANGSVVVSYDVVVNGAFANVGSTVFNEIYIIVGDTGGIHTVDTTIVANSGTASRGAGRDFSDSSKSVDETSAMPGDELTYTIVISNSNGSADQAVSLDDTLPDTLTYVAGSLETDVTGDAEFTTTDDDNRITLTGVISAAASVELTFKAQIDSSGITNGSIITNSATIVGGNEVTTVDAETTITVPPISRKTNYLPVLFKELLAPTISLITKPNSANARTVGWTDGGGANVTYDLQWDDHPEFTSPSEASNVGSLSYQHDLPASYNNVTYYRVRSESTTGQVSGWSNTIAVVGSYRDDFNDAGGDWAIRRTSYLEEVRGFYELNQSWFVMQVDDKWDWGIASPMKPAPEPPYAIEMRVFQVTDGNLISFGIVTRGDSNGQPCLVPGAIYSAFNCFSNFFNANFINQAGRGEVLKLLWEEIDRLVDCPNCGGSRIKRLSDNEGAWRELSDMTPVIPGDWNLWRLEVLSDRQRLYVNGILQSEFVSSERNTNPYFGVFGSTDEYNNSTWRIDWVTVKPMDQ